MAHTPSPFAQLEVTMERGRILILGQTKDSTYEIRNLLDNRRYELEIALSREVAKQILAQRRMDLLIIHTEMLLILDKVVGRQRISRVQVPWRGVPNPPLTTFWQSLQYFLNGTPGRAIILGLEGYHDHWTVIGAITRRSILLYDSAKIRRLPRPYCTTVYTTNKRKHLLLPAQTYFLSNEVEDAE